PRPTRTTSFPYTTLFRSAGHHAAGVRPMTGVGQIAPEAIAIVERPDHLDVHQMGPAEVGVIDQHDITGIEVLASLDYRLGRKLRSEEHTSELQSPYDLVC